MPRSIVHSKLEAGLPDKLRRDLTSSEGFTGLLDDCAIWSSDWASQL